MDRRKPSPIGVHEGWVGTGLIAIDGHKSYPMTHHPDRQLAPVVAVASVGRPMMHPSNLTEVSIMARFRIAYRSRDR
jgi:hypothetical protein